MFAVPDKAERNCVSSFSSVGQSGPAPRTYLGIHAADTSGSAGDADAHLGSPVQRGTGLAKRDGRRAVRFPLFLDCNVEAEARWRRRRSGRHGLTSAAQLEQQ